MASKTQTPATEAKRRGRPRSTAKQIAKTDSVVKEPQEAKTTRKRSTTSAKTPATTKKVASKTTTRVSELVEVVAPETHRKAVELKEQLRRETAEKINATVKVATRDDEIESLRSQVAELQSESRRNALIGLHINSSFIGRWVYRRAERETGRTA